MIEVEVIAERTKGLTKTIRRVIEVDDIGTKSDKENAAALIWFNEYLNRDCTVCTFINMKSARDYIKTNRLGIKIKAEII